jgi:hypothetical protein
LDNYKGKLLEGRKDLIVSETGNGSWNDFISSMKHNFDDPLAILLAQIVMIILVARLWLVFKKIGQPTVMRL